MGAIFQPWSKTTYDIEWPQTIVRDRRTQEVILRIPVTDHGYEAIKDIYEMARMQYLRGYTQGMTDKVNEIKAALGCTD